jgi:YidC/Oxa1 family membrane protein insertase
MEKRIALFFLLSVLILVGSSMLQGLWMGPPPQQKEVAQNQDENQPDDKNPDEQDPHEQPSLEKPADDQAGPGVETTEKAPSDDASDPAADPDKKTGDEAETGEDPQQAEDPNQADLPARPDAGKKPFIGQKPVSPLQEWAVLGSIAVGDDNPYMMAVTIHSAGAAVERIELSREQFRDSEEMRGYLGHLEAEAIPTQDGARVGVVVPGTPAEVAGLKPGDIIRKVDGRAIAGPASLAAVLSTKWPGEELGLVVQRPKQTDEAPANAPADADAPDARNPPEAANQAGAAQLTLKATLIRRPLQVVQPEAATGSKPSFLLTLESLDGLEIKKDEDELANLDLLTGHWELDEKSKSPTYARFTRPLPGNEHLEIVKEYRLEKKVEGDKSKAGYGLDLTVSFHNTATKPDGGKTHLLAYRLDGPTGLPDEGYWYATKIAWEGFSGVGMRDVVFGWWDGGYVQKEMFNCSEIGGDETTDTFRPAVQDPVLYCIGVDAQYFAAMMLPQKKKNEVWFSQVMALRVGKAPENKKRTNTSCRVVSLPFSLAPGASKSHLYTIFAGPKQPELLAQYGDGPEGLGFLVYYGWFGWVSRSMLKLLHFFHWLIPNYGLSIIMLTVLVRSCMIPLSLKQTRSAQKMQELQPEIKKLQEKYKSNIEARTKAQQELFKKHNYNPLGGCGLALVQLPIFIGLYRSLSVDVELRQAPLFWEGFPWCGNLAAPDMLWDWSGVVPGFVIGILGPYFNILPLVTVGLFIVQQKMFMPPATDDQTRMQQQVMQVMMIFMGFLFFRVASGLCIYFIASSLWGLAERKLIRREKKPTGGTTATALQSVAASSGSGGNSKSDPSGGSLNGNPSSAKKKKRNKRK